MTRESPRISVCLPVFNGERYLAEAIESILNQAEKDFELLIADDCSTDGSWQLIEGYAKKDPRVRAWKNEQNLGLFGNWNLTMKEAKGRYIKPFAQDDFCKPELLSALSAALDAHPEVSLAGTAREYFDGTKVYAIEPDARKYYRDKQFDGKDITLKFLLDGENVVGFPPAVMFRREHLGAGFDARYYHCGDVEFFMRLLQEGDYYFLYRPLVSYRYHGQNQTYNNFAQLKYMADLLLLKRDYADFARASGVENFSAIIAEQMASVVAVGRKVLSIDYTEAPDSPIFEDRSIAFEIIIALSDRLSTIKEQLAHAAGTSSPSASQVKEMERLERDNATLTRQNEELHRQLNALLTSTSWKMTRPIRFARRLVSRH